MKIILDNIIYSKVNQGGVSNYWFELSKYLLHQSEDEVFFHEESNVFDNFHRQQLEIPTDAFLSNAKGKFSILSRVKPIKYESEDFFLYHSSYYRALKGVPNHREVTTIHDFTHNYFSPPHKRFVHNQLKFSAIKRSKGLICVSQNTYNDLRKFCPVRSDQKIEIIHNGVSDDYFPIKNYSDLELEFFRENKLEENYVIYVGTRTNYKNFNFVFELLKVSKNIKLVVVGNQLTAAERKLFSDDLLRRTVIFTGITNVELNLLYSNAIALVYPSSYEGFGIPILEAMRAGCPVIALDNSSISEVAGNAGILLKQLEIAEFKENIENLQDNASFRAEIIGKGIEHSKPFSWEKCCQETHNFYKEIASEL
ncbi:glycosyltransferase family 4 protein [Flavobacterium caseinilyticum]|uniref:Glycosyltransferase family 1 protein n=1 Tax=Flavobacterium caseinilyticum TaxID=2541732 RepID=A0A4R5AXF4_9FLAO|nr:glycosyltransferase family 1 protein [Flavobacterium caseinilyticum]TDD78208.1 glycosyltransferase family 1 protein [Flavobacterium caseinilyticum]